MPLSMPLSRIPWKWRTLIAVCFGTFMATMDFSIVNVALPTLAREFDRSPDVVVWVSLGSALVVTGLTLTSGRAGDLYGRKRVYLAGWVIFTLGVTLASVAQSLEQLVAFRIFQAIGMSMAIANSNAIVTAAFPDNERGKALGTVGAVVGAGLMSGPIVGGLLLGVAEWRAIFYLRIPIGLLAIVMGYLEIREPARERTLARRMDIPGAILLFATLAPILTALNRGVALGWTSPVILGMLAAGIAAAAAFVRVEARSPSPIVALALFRTRRFAASVASLVPTFIGQSAVTFLMPFYLIEVRDFSTAQTGLMISMVPLMMLIFAPLSGLVHDRLQWPHQATVGVALMTVGLFLLATITDGTPVAFVLAWLAFIGLGAVLFNAPNSATIMGSVPRSMLGTASAAVVTGRNVGNTSGLALASTVVVGVAGAAGASVADLPPEDLLRGIRAAFVVAASLSILGIVASAMRGGSEAGHEEADAVTPEPATAPASS